MGKGKESTSDLQMHRWANVGAGDTLGVWLCPLSCKAGEMQVVKMGNNGISEKVDLVGVAKDEDSWSQL